MKSSDYSNNLFSAIDIIVDKKIQELSVDKTIKCSVVSESKGLQIEVSYQG
jgi:hypothetical protein